MNNYNELEVTEEELEYWQILISQIKFARELEHKETDNDLFGQGTGSLRESS